MPGSLIERLKAYVRIEPKEEPKAESLLFGSAFSERLFVQARKRAAEDARKRAPAGPGATRLLAAKAVLKNLSAKRATTEGVPAQVAVRFARTFDSKGATQVTVVPAIVGSPLHLAAPVAPLSEKVRLVTDLVNQAAQASEQRGRIEHLLEKAQAGLASQEEIVELLRFIVSGARLLDEMGISPEDDAGPIAEPNDAGDAPDSSPDLE